MRSPLRLSMHLFYNPDLSKKTVELIEYYEKLKNLEIQNKENKILESKQNKKINKKTYKKKKYYKKSK